MCSEERVSLVVTIIFFCSLSPDEGNLELCAVWKSSLFIKLSRAEKVMERWELNWETHSTAFPFFYFEHLSCRRRHFRTFLREHDQLVFTAKLLPELLSPSPPIVVKSFPTFVNKGIIRSLRQTKGEKNESLVLTFKLSGNEREWRNAPY